MRVMALDPGIMTGYCYGVIEEKKLKYHPFQSTDQVDDLWRRFREWKPRYIIIEDFQFRRGKMAAGGLELFPVQLIGVTNLYGLIADHQTAVYVQQPAQGKSYYTNPVLQKEKLYQRGIPHAMDASRHLLHWFTFGAGYQFNEGKDNIEMVPHPSFLKGGGTGSDQH